MSIIITNHAMRQQSHLDLQQQWDASNVGYIICICTELYMQFWRHQYYICMATLYFLVRDVMWIQLIYCYTLKKDITIDLHVTLDELYLSRVKKLTVKTMNFGTEIKRIIYVLLLADAQDKYVYVGVGDNGGDIIVRINIALHPIFAIDCIDSSSLTMTMHVPFWDYLYGGSYEIINLDGSKNVVQYAAQSGTRSIVIKGIGLPVLQTNSHDVHHKQCELLHDKNQESRGDLYVFFDVILPRLDPEQLANPLNSMILHKLFRSGK